MLPLSFMTKIINYENKQLRSHQNEAKSFEKKLFILQDFNLVYMVLKVTIKTINSNLHW